MCFSMGTYREKEEEEKAKMNSKEKEVKGHVGNAVKRNYTANEKG